MKMVSMRLSKKAANRLRKNMLVAEPEAPKYPWGLTLHLENEAVDLLGISPSDYDAGDEVMLAARAKVTSTSVGETEAGGKNKSIGLQITHLSLGWPGEDAE
ncbi:MAG: capsid staple protein [Desulfobacterales bacterium]